MFSMNVMYSGVAEKDRQELTDLASCCSVLAAHSGNDELSVRLKDLSRENLSADKKRQFIRVVEVARKAGLKTVISRPGKDDWTGAGVQFPAVMELKDGTFRLAVAFEQESKDLPGLVHLLKSQDSETPVTEKISFDELHAVWAGGLLRFQKINTALTCFSIVAREHNIDVTPERLRHEYGEGLQETDGKRLTRMAKDLGAKLKSVRMDWDGFFSLHRAFPVIVRMNNGTHQVVTGVSQSGGGGKGDAVACYDPLSGNAGAHVRVSREDFEQLWSGQAYLFKRVYRLRDRDQPFSLRWFIPEILKEKIPFMDVALAVLFINFIALVTPIFFQIVIDKVLVNQAFTTLHVLGLGMVAMLLVNGCLDFLRDYLLLHATNKIDLRVTARTFSHLLQLPQDFFEKVTAGVLTKHMQQTSSIRGFLTGSVFLTMLEATSLLVFLPFLFLYSVQLTAIVMLFTAAVAVVIFALIPPFRSRLGELYDAEGERQAMLVETINGMPTVKAMAVEPMLRNRWETKVARAVSMQFRVGRISITARAITQLLERLMIVVLVWTGAGLVFDGTLTVGALIAFQMLAGRVTSPLVRLVGLVHQYQEASLSVEKLGVVMNARKEWGADRHGARPSLHGDIVFDRVSFRYGPDLPHSLKDISLVVPAGHTLGIVGPSGSGKTTLTRLLQKAYFPSSGTIRINDCYLAEIDTAHLRSNTGVVLQESFLFRNSVAENIRAGQTGAGREQIIEAAVLAGADEFIVKLPQGYDTLLEEGASNLSGGQRQRLAIARALLTRPGILILDEATSSLDPESERIVRKNLGKISGGRTVIVVSHRLSMLTGADSIVVLEDGKIAGHGPHDRLLENCPLYASLWKQQTEV
jgi:subfamily B ATP-binding cassette protein HlyB/CyaB